jgi:hypothetical protein
LRVTWWVTVGGFISMPHQNAFNNQECFFGNVERFEEGRGELHSFWHTKMLWRFHSRVKRRDSIHIIRHTYAALELHCLKKNCREVCRPRAQ